MDSSENNYSKAFIYIDTNKLETKFSNDQMFLNEIIASNAFYEVVDLIKDLSIQDKVSICIPEIVILELKKHMISHYKSLKDSLEDKIDVAHKAFGDLIELDCEFILKTSEEYEKKLDYIISDFIYNPRYSISVIPYPREQETFERIVHKATQTIKPFVRIKGPNKHYSDAGLKDAIILETLIDNTKNELGILFSDDRDFVDAIKDDNLFLCNTSSDIKDILIDKLGLKKESNFDEFLNNNEYLMKRILDECGFNEEEQHEFIRVLEYSENDSVAFIEFVMEIEGTAYIFNVELDMTVKELVSVSCSEYYEDEFDETE